MIIAKPVRATHTFVQRLIAPPETVFPLLCPVREVEWAEGWSPVSVWSDCGLAELDCVFVTQDDDAEAIWTITRHEPERFFVEMVRVVPGKTVCRLTIQLAAVGTGSTAEITYRHTSLGRAGDAFVAEFSEARYAAFMQQWQDELNRFVGPRSGSQQGTS